MTTYKDWRRQPFTSATYQVVLAEVHTVIFYDDWNAYGIQLAEGIYLENPSSVEIVENVTGGATFTEISRTTPPIAGQFRVDYEADTFTGTSRIEFNAADVGTEVLVTYKGLGLIASTENYQNYLANKTVPGDFGVQDDLTVGNNLSVGNNLDVTNDASVGGDLSIQGLITFPKAISIDNWINQYLANDITLTASTMNLTNGAYARIRNLNVSGASTIRGNALGVFSIIEVIGDLNLASGASLNLIRTLLIVHGNVNVTTSGSIISPNGANGGNGGAGVATNGSDAVNEFGGSGGALSGDTGGGGGGIGAGGAGGGIGGVGQAGGAGAGGGAGGAGGGAGGVVNIWSGGGGAGATSALGSGGGGGAGNIHLIFFQNVSSNLSIITGKGGVGGSGIVDGTGGQSGSIYIARRNSQSGYTTNVTAGTSTGTNRDGSAGSVNTYILETNSGQLKPVLLHAYEYYIKAQSVSL